MFKYLKQILIGKPLKTVEEGGQKLSKIKALALLSPDALSSVAYGTESITTTLLVAGSVALWLQVPVAILVLVLLAAITLSYRQIIHAYPSGGGAYAVASKNWGPKIGLVAGGSLLVDYMLTAAVSATAAAQAIVAAFPNVAPFSVFIAVFIIIFLSVLNLRGLRESANFLQAPVYLFIFSIILMLAVGTWEILTGQITNHATAQIGQSASNITLLLFLRAFSSGSSSLTGVEAISNAVPTFNQPREKNAAKTLSIMAIILGIFFFGITLFSFWFGIKPETDKTVLSQIAGQIFGSGSIGFYLIQIATALILSVAVNTGFSAFPMLAFNLAKDRYMPHLYMDKGDRLGYSNGILSLMFGAILLIVIFNGSTEHLIPLYAIGVFVPFTLSQSGMVRHWFREKSTNWQVKASVNTLGALISAVLVVTIFILRFDQIWPYLVIMPILLFIFSRVRHHYMEVARQLKITAAKVKKADKKRAQFKGTMVIVLVSNVTEVTNEAITHALAMGEEVIALHVSLDTDPKQEKSNRKLFAKNFPSVRYVDVHSSYRAIVSPVQEFVNAMKLQADKKNYSLNVVVPQFVPAKPWQNILHNQSALRLRSALAQNDDILITSYYYHLTES